MRIRTPCHLSIFGKPVQHCFLGMCCLGMCVTCVFINITLDLFLHLLIHFFSGGTYRWIIVSPICHHTQVVFDELVVNCRGIHIYTCRLLCKICRSLILFGNFILVIIQFYLSFHLYCIFEKKIIWQCRCVNTFVFVHPRCLRSGVKSTVTLITALYTVLKLSTTKQSYSSIRNSVEFITQHDSFKDGNEKLQRSFF